MAAFPWVKVRGRSALQVEIGADRVPLTAMASSEQAIAQIELHLQGKGDRAVASARSAYRCRRLGSCRAAGGNVTPSTGSPQSRPGLLRR